MFSANDDGCAEPGNMSCLEVVAPRSALSPTVSDPSASNQGHWSRLADQGGRCLASLGASPRARRERSAAPNLAAACVLVGTYGPDRPPPDRAIVDGVSGAAVDLGPLMGRFRLSTAARMREPEPGSPGAEELRK